MSAEIVNLRKARKAKARKGKEQESAANRERFGRSKAERERQALEAERQRRALEGAWRGACEDDGSDGRE